MREIKFKGKAKMTIGDLDKIGIKHSNGWVEGNLIQNGKDTWILGRIIEVDTEYIAHEFWVRVDSETVGQYTGSKDKHSNDIYEGAAVKTYNGDKAIVKFGAYKDNEIVNHDEDYYQDFDGDERETIGFFVEHLNGDCCGLDNRTDKWIEVIGEITERGVKW